jgi:hypothetical protein
MFPVPTLKLEKVSDLITHVEYKYDSLNLHALLLYFLDKFNDNKTLVKTESSLHSAERHNTKILYIPYKFSE